MKEQTEKLIRNLIPTDAPIYGMVIHEAISRIEGIKCGYKATSCPDQLSLALKEYLSNNQ